MLAVEGLTLGYGPVEVVHGLDLEVGEGQIVAVLGRNGAGKTTLLNGITGVLRPRAGSISFLGKPVSHAKISNIARLGMAFVPEGRGCFPGLTVWENLAAAAYGHGLRGRNARAEMQRALAYFPAIEDRLTQRAGSMSGGEQQMLVIARALVGRPRLLLVDEPGLGLSPILVSSLYGHFLKLNQEEGLSILLVEQYVDLAINSAHVAYVLQKGRVVHQGPCSEIKQSHELVSAYIG